MIYEFEEKKIDIHQTFFTTPEHRDYVVSLVKERKNSSEKVYQTDLACELLAEGLALLKEGTISLKALPKENMSKQGINCSKMWKSLFMELIGYGSDHGFKSIGTSATHILHSFLSYELSSKKEKKVGVHTTTVEEVQKGVELSSNEVEISSPADLQARLDFYRQESDKNNIIQRANEFVGILNEEIDSFLKNLKKGKDNLPNHIRLAVDNNVSLCKDAIKMVCDYFTSNGWGEVVIQQNDNGIYSISMYAKKPKKKVNLSLSNRNGVSKTV